ncbi:MAG: HIT domain-containing protein [Candidatus Abawacabacteria bacterium]|nr:HIT domain-containing protein [Candidatus Abawacabacteria bacterium]
MMREGNVGTLVDPRYADTEYAASLKEYEEEGICPFCPAGLERDKRVILNHACGWFVTDSIRPYKDRLDTIVPVHALLIPDRHIVSPLELEVDDMMAIRELLRWVMTNKGIDSGAMNMRFGINAGSTVRHIHVHIISPNLDQTGSSVPVDFPIG